MLSSALGYAGILTILLSIHIPTSLSAQTKIALETTLREKWVVDTIDYDLIPVAWRFDSMTWAPAIDTDGGSDTAIVTPNDEELIYSTVQVEGVDIGILANDMIAHNPLTDPNTTETSFNALYPEGLYEISIDYTVNLIANDVVNPFFSGGFPDVDPEITSLNPLDHVTADQVFSWADLADTNVDEVGFLLLEGQFATELVDTVLESPDAITDSLLALFQDGAAVIKDDRLIDMSQDTTHSISMTELNPFQDHIVLLYFMVNGSGEINQLETLQNINILPQAVEDAINDKLADYNSSPSLTNLLGKVGNMSATLMLYPKVVDVEIQVQPRAQELFAGDTLYLDVLATGTDITYKWFHNDAEIPGETGYSLQIDDAQPGDAGNYYCRVSSIYSDLDTDTVVVNVTPITHYSDYRAYYFSGDDLADDAVSGPLADPDRDSIPNWLEYAWTADPTMLDSMMQPQVSVVPDETNQEVTVAFTRFKDAVDLSFRLDKKLELTDGSWAEVTNANDQLLTDIVPDGSKQTVTYTFVISGDVPNLFLQWIVAEQVD